MVESQEASLAEPMDVAKEGGQACSGTQLMPDGTFFNEGTAPLLDTDEITLAQDGERMADRVPVNTKPCSKFGLSWYLGAWPQFPRPDLLFERALDKAPEGRRAAPLLQRYFGGLVHSIVHVRLQPMFGDCQHKGN